MIDDKIVRCRNWMKKIINSPNVDGWQNMVDTPDDDFTDHNFATVDTTDDNNYVFNYEEYVKKVMLTEEKYKLNGISRKDFLEYSKSMDEDFKEDFKNKSFADFLKSLKSKKEKEEEKSEKEKEEEKINEAKQERFFKRFDAMQKKYPYLTDMEISEKLRAEDEKVEKDKESYKDNNDLLDEAKKEYERMHGKNLDIQIKRAYKLIKNGTKFNTALKTCKIPDSYKKYTINVIQKLKQKE